MKYVAQHKQNNIKVLIEDENTLNWYRTHPSVRRAYFIHEATKEEIQELTGKTPEPVLVKPNEDSGNTDGKEEPSKAKTSKTK